MNVRKLSKKVDRLILASSSITVPEQYQFEPKDLIEDVILHNGFRLTTKEFHKDGYYDPCLLIEIRPNNMAASAIADMPSYALPSNLDVHFDIILWLDDDKAQDGFVQIDPIAIALIDYCAKRISRWERKFKKIQKRNIKIAKRMADNGLTVNFDIAKTEQATKA